MSNRPPATEVPPYYQNYVALVPEDDIIAALAEQAKKTAALLRLIGEEKASFRYAPGKWSVKQVIGHFTDAERIFAYRALAIARGESKSLPGFDEKAYADAGDFDRRSIRDLADDYEAGAAQRSHFSAACPTRPGSATELRTISPSMSARWPTSPSDTSGII